MLCTKASLLSSPSTQAPRILCWSRVRSRPTGAVVHARYHEQPEERLRLRERLRGLLRLRRRDAAGPGYESAAKILIGYIVRAHYQAFPLIASGRSPQWLAKRLCRARDWIDSTGMP